MYVLFIIILILIVYKNLDYFRYNRNHLKYNKFLKEESNFIDIDTCKNISKTLLNHPQMGLGGFCIRFTNNEHTEDNFSKNGLTEIYNIFKMVKAPGTIQYVCNILILPVSSGITIGEHYDGTQETTDWLNRQYMPMCTSVVYLNLPNKFEGGELFLKKFNTSRVYKIVKPSIGKMVEFRGDMSHGVYEIHSEENIDRLSLVFEQYTVSDNTTFEIEPIFTEVRRVGNETHFS